MRAVPRPFHRTPKRRQRQTVVFQIHQLPIGKAPSFRPRVLLLKGIPGLRRRRGRHDGLLVLLFRAALIAEPFPPGGQKLPALCAARPWIFVSDVRVVHPFRDKVGSSAGVEPAPSRCAAGAHPHAPAAHMGGLFFPGTPSASGIGPHYKTRREGDSNPTMPSGGCLISPCGRVLSHPARRPRHRVAACVQYRAAGLSRLSCVTDFRIATAFYPCGGRPLTIGRVRLLAGCSTHRRAANIRGFIPGRITPAGMVPEFRPERHLFPQCEAVLGFTQTCQKRSVPMSFRDRGHAQLHPLVAGFRPPRPRLSGVPVWGERRVSGRPESNRPSVGKGPIQRARGRSSDRIQAPVGCRVIRHTAQGRRPQKPAGRQPYFFTCHAI